jgi:serine/threonine-protein kinase
VDCEKEIKDSSGYVIAEYISFRKFKSIVLAVAYYVNLKTNGEKLPWRYLSNKILRHPRALISYKNEIALSAGITLDELDSVFLSDINGNFTCTPNIKFHQ